MTDAMPDADDDPVLHFRNIAAGVWLTAIGFFGRPAEIFRRGHVSRSSFRIMRGWIRSLEKLVRRIIFFAALSLNLPEPAEAATHLRSTSNASAIPPGRRVSLRIFHRSLGHRHARGWRERGEPNDLPVRAAPLARRLEALRHALKFTDLHARNLARVLARRLRDGKPLPVLNRWLVAPSRMTGGEYEIDAPMTAIEPLIQTLLDARKPEPG